MFTWQYFIKNIYILGADGERSESDSTLVDQLHKEFMTTPKEEQTEKNDFCKFGVSKTLV